MSNNVPTYIGLNYDDTNTDFPVFLNKSLEIIDQNLHVGRNLLLDGNFYKIYNNTTYNVLDMDSAGNLAFSYGPWNAGLGTTKYLGNNIQISSKGTISINTSSTSSNITVGNSNGFLYLDGKQRSNTTNAILWSGGSTGYYMIANQSVTLSENVSAQAHGIVLAWSAYSTSDGAQNFGWNYTFVPKAHVTNHSGAGIACPMADPDRIGMKYVYVSNNKITGNDRNDDEGNVPGTNNVKFNNKYWVLRAVYGV